MFGDRRLFEDMARVAGGAASALGGIRSRMESEMRDQIERLLSRMNLVTREEFDVIAAVAAKARSEQEMLETRLAALESRLARADAPRRAGKAKAAEPAVETPRKAPARRRTKA